ncbi:hypothetical protein GSI_02345 [Ganoderma sinense ZZ0214-1]|uniref:Uncharacterized protein n=1 Tax=Ganoderma sinense ZZ0214-1 TaxID=1077348 RepID=A0A2G8SPB6_9APHY|nr:hypothetical protein GSI_02345 [Ganoderma sinense ZZ0214-1]
MASTRIEIDGAQRTVKIYGPATIAFTISSHVRAPLQRVATSVHSVRTISREPTQIDIESGMRGNEAQMVGETKSQVTSPSTQVVADTGTATSDPPADKRGAKLLPRRDSDPEEPSEAWWDRVCNLFHRFPEHIATVVWRTLGVCFRKVFLSSIAYALCGLFLLGLAKGRDGVYADVSALSVVVACACGSGIVAGGCGVLMFVFGTGGGMTWTVDQLGEVASVFIPAIAVGVTRGHIRGLSPAFTAIDALKVGGVGLGGFLVCYILYNCCVDIEGVLKPETQRAEGHP